MSAYVASRLSRPGPKRMLALDGGGARGIVSIGFLEAVEDLLRKRHGRNDYVISDYFDMIGGTSVGSIVATMLALGWPMQKVREEFWRICPEIFSQRVGRGYIWPRFSVKALRRNLERELGEMRLDSDKLKTGLAIVSKRLDTGSAWVMYNNAHSEYWPTRINPVSGKKTVGNSEYRLADIIQASTAAPTYFRPHWIQIEAPSEGSEGQRGLFVDGGLSPYNNPSLLMFMMAGISGYRLGGVKDVTGADGKTSQRGVAWELGANKLLIVSVGTGDYRVKMTSQRMTPAVAFGGQALLGTIADNQATTLKLMQWLADPKRPWTINGEVDDLRWDNLGKLIGGTQSLLSFTRYNIKLEEKWLREKLKVDYFSDARLASLRRLDNPTEMHTYLSLSRAAAAYQVTDDDFPEEFNT